MRHFVRAIQLQNFLRDRSRAGLGRFDMTPIYLNDEPAQGVVGYTLTGPRRSKTVLPVVDRPERGHELYDLDSAKLFCDGVDYATRKLMHTVTVHFTNGSEQHFPFPSHIAARAFCRNGISYSGGRVRRVTLNDTQAIWDASWDDRSRYHGLND